MKRALRDRLTAELSEIRRQQEALSRQRAGRLDLGLTIQPQREVEPVLRAAPPPRLAEGIIAKMKAKWGWK